MAKPPKTPKEKKPITIKQPGTAGTASFFNPELTADLKKTRLLGSAESVQFIEEANAASVENLSD